MLHIKIKKEKDYMNNFQELIALIEVSDFENADTLCSELRSNAMHDENLKELQRQIHDNLTKIRLPGPDYLEWLQWFHQDLQPTTYLEIGVESGQSLQFVKENTKAIGIDPAPRIVHGIPAWSRLYKTTSDEFFATYDPTKIFENRIDFAFIDGLHYYDQVLRDFINIEKHCYQNSIILFHDVYPAIPATATREWTTIYWAGDTWKIMPILQRYRPDLKIVTIPAYPTGLSMITNLDPKSTILEHQFDSIVAEMAQVEYNSYQPINLISNDFDNMQTQLKIRNI